MFMCDVSPGRSSDKISIQQPQLAEQNSVDKRHSGQLLQGQMGLKLEFLLFHEEGHCFNVSTRIKHTSQENTTKKKLVLKAAEQLQCWCFSLCFHANSASSSEMIQHRNLKKTNQVFFVNNACKRGENVHVWGFKSKNGTYLETFRVLWFSPAALQQRQMTEKHVSPLVSYGTERRNFAPVAPSELTIHDVTAGGFFQNKRYKLDCTNVYIHSDVTTNKQI